MRGWMSAVKKARWRARQLWWLSFGREVRHVKEGREHTLPVGEWRVVKRKTVIRVGYNAGTSCGASTMLTVRRIGEGFDVRRLRVSEGVEG